MRSSTIFETAVPRDPSRLIASAAPGCPDRLAPTRSSAPVRQAECGAQTAPVRRLIRHRHTRRYFTEQGWTENPHEAKVFGDVVEAAATCARCGLNEVELAVRFEGGACDLFCTVIC